MCTERRSRAVDEIIRNEVDEMTNMEILIEAIKIIAEKSETKQEFIEELERLQKKKPQ